VSPSQVPGEFQTVDSRRALVSGALIIVATAIVLRAMGRVWWCACGRLVPWSWDIWSSHNSQHVLDPYAFTHVLHGVFFFFAFRVLIPRVSADKRFLLAAIIESGWEILENSPVIIERYRSVTMSQDYFGDSIANSIADILACVGGYWLAGRLGWRWSLVLFVTIELLLLATIRDCLTLNVIMLLHPIEAVKQWQMGS
jgi:hypothetical protein